MKIKPNPALYPLVSLLLIGCQPSSNNVTENKDDTPAPVAEESSGIAGTPTSYQDSVSQAGNKCYEITGVLDYDETRDFPLAQVRLNYVRKSDPRKFVGDQTIFIGGVYIRDIRSVESIPKKMTIRQAVMNSSMGFLLPMEAEGGVRGTVFYGLPSSFESGATEKLDASAESGTVRIKRYTTDLGQGTEVFTGQGLIVFYLRTVNMKDSSKNVQLSNAIAFPVDFDETPPRITGLE